MKRFVFICAVLFLICSCDNATKDDGESNGLTLYQFTVDYVDDDGNIKLTNSTNRSFIISNAVFLNKGHIVDAESLEITSNNNIDIIYITLERNSRHVTLKPGDFIFFK